MKKLFALLLVFMVSVSFAALGAAEDEATPVYASGDYEYTLNSDGNAVITRYNGQDETVDVPAALDGYPVVGIGEKAFHDCSLLTSINLPECLQSIGDWAFRDCSSLQSIHLPEGLLSIGYEAFQDCQALTTINFPDGFLTIDIAAFDNCSSLVSVILPNSLQSIGYGTFDGCEELTLIVPRDSYAHEYAKEEGGMRYQLSDSEDIYITLYDMPEEPDFQIEVPDFIEVPTAPPSVELPMNGEIHFYSKSDTDLVQNEWHPLIKDSGISIAVPSGEDYYLVTLADPNTHMKRIVIFIYPGETVDAEIPSGEYWLYYTCGQTWYGFDEKFGPMAARTRSEESDLFEKDYGWSYTLYTVSDGNLSTESVSLEDYLD